MNSSAREKRSAPYEDRHDFQYFRADAGRSCLLQRQDRHPGRQALFRRCARRRERPHYRCGVSRSRDASRERQHAAGRPQRPHGHSRSERLPPAHHSRRAELQHGVALGRRAVARGRARHAEEAGGPHAGAAMGARGGRLERIPVRRAARPDARRNQRDCAGHAGVHPASVRQRATECGGAARGRLYERHTQSSRRRDSARQARQSDRHADRTAERRTPVRDAGERSEARAGGSAQFHAPFHA